MYKEVFKVKSFDNDEETVNIETVGKRDNWGYLRYFDCRKCENQSISDDSGLITACNNYSDFSDTTDTKLYCRNYKR